MILIDIFETEKLYSEEYESVQILTVYECEG